MTKAFAGCVLLVITMACSLAVAGVDHPVCSYENANYGKSKLQSVHILRNGQRIATVSYVPTFDIYYVQCKGIPSQERFQTPNDAAWAACWRCQ